MENKTDFVTLSMLKEMMAIQDSAFRASTQLIIEDFRSEMKTIKKEFEEFKISIRYTSDKYDDVSEKMKKMDVEINAVYRQIDILSNNMDREIEKLEVKHDYIENHSRRNKIKIMGVEEKNEEKTWEYTEKVVQKLFQEKLGFSDAIEIERARRVGENDKERHLAQTSNPDDGQRPRPIVARISSWKTKERILKEARSKRPKGVLFLNDFLKRLLDRRAEQIPQRLKARQEGKVAYMVMDKLVIHAHRKDENPRKRGRPNSGEPPDTELSRDQNFTNVEDEVFVKNARRRR